MAITPSATAASRRNLVQRIERFLGAVDWEARSLDTWETDLIRRAIAKLQASDFVTGEYVMIKVERRDLYRSERAAAANGPTLTTDDVRASLARVLKGTARP